MTGGGADLAGVDAHVDRGTVGLLPLDAVNVNDPALAVDLRTDSMDETALILSL